jgi:hypothetical protein
MEGEVPLMTKDGQMVVMVKIPEGHDLPDIIRWSGRIFILKNGGFVEVLVQDILDVKAELQQ